MGNNPYCESCFNTCCLNDGYGPIVISYFKIKDVLGVEVYNMWQDDAIICINCLKEIKNKLGVLIL